MAHIKSLHWKEEGVGAEQSGEYEAKRDGRRWCLKGWGHIKPHREQ